MSNARPDKLDRLRERYANDDEYRTRRLESAARWKQKHTENAVEREPEFVEIGGQNVRVFSAVEASAKIGVTSALLTYWWKNLDTPPPVKSGKKNYYTKHQLQLLAKLASAAVVGGKSKQDIENRNAVIRYVWKNWYEGL